MRRRSVLLSLAALSSTVLATASPTVAGAAQEELVPVETMVRVGGTVELRGSFCATGATVTALTARAVPVRAKGVPPFTPVDHMAAGLVQDADGFSFHLAATDEYTRVEAQAVCSDGTTGATTTGVEVFPATGFWWSYDNYDPYFTATQGFVFFFGAGAMECAAGASATATIAAPRSEAALVTLDATFGADRHVVFDVDIPASWASGVYTGTISCTTAGGTVSDSEPIFVGVQPDDPATGMPASGLAPLPLSLTAGTLLALGALAMLAARRATG